jgi:hypothetical protein
MAPTDQETEVVPPAEEPEEMPLPSDPKVIFLGGLFVLALLATAYVASEIVLPLVFAFILKLLLQPAMRILERLHVPNEIRTHSALGKDAPLGRAVQRSGGIVAIPILSGLHHITSGHNFRKGQRSCPAIQFRIRSEHG